MALGSIVVRLTMNTADFDTDTKRAASLADKRAKEIDASFKRSALAIGAVLGTAVVAGVGIAANAIRDATDRMDDLSKAALRVSLPTEQFSGLVYAGKLADVEMSTLTTTLGRLTKAQADSLKSTSEQAKVFKALGISATDAEGNLRSSYDVLLDFADAFKRQEGSPEIVAAGMKIFGKSFADIIPLIKDGSDGLRSAAEEAEAFGQIVSTEAGQAAEAFNDNLSRLGMLASGLANAVAQELLPDMEKLSASWVEAAKDGDGLKSVAQDIATVLRALATVIDGVATASKSLATVWQSVVTSALGMSDAIAGVLTLDTDRIKFGAGEVAGAWTRAWDAVSGTDAQRQAASRAVSTLTGADLIKDSMAEQARMKGLWGAQAEAERLRKLAFGDEPKKPGRTGGGKGTGKSDAERELEQTQRAYESLMATMGQRIALFNTEGEAARVRYETEHGALLALDPALKKLAISRAEELDQMERVRREGEARMRMAEEETQRIRRGLEYGKDMLDDLRFELELMRMTNAERATAIQLRGMEAEAIAEYGEAIAQANRDIEASMREIQIIDDMRGSFQGFFEDVMGGTKSVKDAFADMLNDIARRISQFVAQRLVEQMFGQFGTNQSGSAGGWMQAFAGLFAGGRSGGGGVTQGNLYRVNERGVETLRIPGREDFLMMGQGSGRVMPAGSGGGAVTVNMSNNYAAPQSNKTVTQVAARTSYELGRARRLGR